MRCVLAAQIATLSETIVHADRPWIQLKWPGVSRLMPNELNATQYMVTNQTRPTRRCSRSPLRRRSTR